MLCAMHAEHKQSTRQVILDCVVALIEERGESAVRIADITEQTGVSISSIYHFFSDREGLIAAAQAERYVRSIDAQLSRLKEMLSGEGTESEVEEIALAMFALVNAPERSLVRKERLSVLGSTVGRPLLAAKVAEIQDRFVLEFGALVQEAQDRGLVRNNFDATAVAAFAMGVMLGRSLIEIGPSSVDQSSWNAIFNATLSELFLGEAKQTPLA
jgi:AcrR family transcriptional regulator